MKKKILSLLFIFGLCVSPARAQTAEVVISLNEQFFDSLLDAIFKNTNPPEFPLASNSPVHDSTASELRTGATGPSANGLSAASTGGGPGACPETIRLEREIDGVRTSVRFRDGKIFVPIAFRGNYNPPLIGCFDFSGVAETNIELDFDRERRTLIGRARILTVNLTGTRGVGGNLIAGLVQSSIDKRINPIQIIEMEKVSFVVPIQNAGALKMRAVGIKPEVGAGVLNVRINYEFAKAP